MTLRLMCVLAHPDDESLGAGGILARYASEGVETSLVMATRGERGWAGEEKDNPGLTALGKIREAELMAAAEILGLREVVFLDYIDGDLDRADPVEAITKIAAHIRRRRPQVVVTFGPEGAYGHPDHIAISQFTTAAALAAADPEYPTLPPSSWHRVSKLYFLEDSEEMIALYERLFGEITMHVDGIVRRALVWPKWMLTTQVDAEAHWPTVWRAAQCHRTQLAPLADKLHTLTEEDHKVLWGRPSFYRAYSLVNGGRAVERDLFEGLR